MLHARQVEGLVRSVQGGGEQEGEEQGEAFHGQQRTVPSRESCARFWPVNKVKR